MLVCRARDYNFPPLPLQNWVETKDYLHLILQMVGKIRLGLHPKLNHWWHATLYPSTKGLTTGLIPYCDRDFEIEIDLQQQGLDLHFSDCPDRRVPIGSRSVAAVYHDLFQQLEERQYPVTINARPYKLSTRTPFDAQTTAPRYDPVYAELYQQILHEVNNIFQEFRGRFSGKATPVHWFWHSFDLAYTRFSGRKAPPRLGGNRVDREAYSHEVISFGFWPGDVNFPEAAFYAYCYPSPPGLSDQPLQPEEAYWGQLNGSPYALLLYEDMRTSANPRQTLLDFLESAYQAAAKLSQWPVADFKLESLPMR